jgi:hypothetical protein
MEKHLFPDRRAGAAVLLALYDEAEELTPSLPPIEECPFTYGAFPEPESKSGGLERWTLQYYGTYSTVNGVRK